MTDPQPPLRLSKDDDELRLEVAANDPSWSVLEINNGVNFERAGIALDVEAMTKMRDWLTRQIDPDGRRSRLGMTQ